mmetsp:Transcript_2952/g.6715  ORF Transcript_2952/g.6715 Transcript_2952/m.6715 type:complete len:118 (+) Transcript_2952:455-808(+)
MCSGARISNMPAVFNGRASKRVHKTLLAAHRVGRSSQTGLVLLRVATLARVPAHCMWTGSQMMRSANCSFGAECGGLALGHLETRRQAEDLCHWLLCLQVAQSPDLALQVGRHLRLL